ncbi:O-methyltransferase [Acinetobacter sp. MD2(2019)]|uniref:O-methyltransferase n=1 Tax=Acinetobacter sp. MD2(2019) TaxID=2605273 RepID=UPI002D1EB2C8|nr:class I SAM-dependent methyltransferase [Acinetobacter sp. MD2(2019)]MEB3753842.1 class I SAM-dependent methyltransferase [Acinetobacter sp. MD2(2019)]
MFDAEFLNQQHQLYLEYQQHDLMQNHRLARYRNIEPDSAQFLAQLILTQHSQNILEIGTSTGFSTLWLAKAAEITRGEMTTLEIDVIRSQMAAQKLKPFNLKTTLNFCVADALDFLKTTQQTFDFILLDAERDAYVEYWRYLPHLLRKNGVCVVDNVLSHADEIEVFKAQVQSDTAFLTTTLAIGAGLMFITKL